MSQEDLNFPRDAKITRERILKEGRKLFAQASYETVGTREIADAASVNASLINRYFGSKKGLFNEIIMSMAEEYQGLTTLEELREKSQDTLTEVLTDKENQPAVDELKLILASSFNPELAETISELFGKIKDSTARALPGEEKETRAGLIISLGLGFILVNHIMKAKSSPKMNKDLARKYYTHIMEELYKENGPLS